MSSLNKSPIQAYEFIDFKNINDFLLKKQAEDNYLISFLNTIKEEYCFLSPLAYHYDFSLLIIHKSLFPFLQKISKYTKDLECSLELKEYENKKIFFYFLNYELKKKIIYMNKKECSLEKINTKFSYKTIYNFGTYIINENKEMLHIRKSKIIGGGNNTYFLFEDELLKQYFLNQINTLILKDLKLLENKMALKELRADFNILKNSYNIQNFTEKILNTKIPFNLNSLDLFMSLSFGIILSFIHPNEHNKMYQFLIKNKNYSTKEAFVNLRYKRRKFSSLNILKLYFYDKLKPKTEDEKYLILNYTHLIYITKSIVNLNIKSFRRMKEEHDILVKKLEKIQIPSNTKLKIKEHYLALKLPKEFRLLKTQKELYLQGIKQKNCVYTRMNEINKGRSAVYDLNYREKKYTLELRKRKKGFIIFELKGFENQSPTKEIRTYVEDLIKKINQELFV